MAQDVLFGTLLGHNALILTLISGCSSFSASTPNTSRSRVVVSTSFGVPLDGQATLKLDWKDAKAQSLVLDTRDLKIAKVEAVDAAGKATALKYALAPADKQLGSKLTIQAPQHPAQVRIAYTTAPTASGLQWLTPEQTADKKLPFMFSQSESIHARSWVPL